MPSFILRQLDPEFWAKVQAKAAAEGTTVKAVILRLLAAWLAAVIVLSITACGYHNPTAPTPPALPQPGVPSRIELTANPGVGADAGTGVITLRVLDALNSALPGQTVTVTASEGSLSAASVVTDAKGNAHLTITGPAGAAIAITATAGTAVQKTSIAMQAGPDAPLPFVPPVFPPPAPPQPPAPPPPAPTPSYTVTVTASPSSLVVNGSATLTAAVVLVNGATAPTGYAWDCDADGKFDAPLAANVKVCPYTTAGTIKSAVRVTGANASGQATVEVTVAAAAPLLVAITAVPTGTLTTGVSVTYTATLSSTGPVPTTGINWEWDLDGDGTYDLVSASHVTTDIASDNYSAPKEFTVKARATDTATGRTAVGTRAVKVS